MPLPLPQLPFSSGSLAPAAVALLLPLLLAWMPRHDAWALPLQTSNSQEVVLPVWLAAPWQGEAGPVAFSVAAFGKEFVLHLEPDASFLAPGLKIQHIGRKEAPGILAEEDAGLRRKCFYSGTVNSQPDSLVAVSLCQGIHGSFLADGDKYLIQPHGHGSGDPLVQIHQLQKRGWAKLDAAEVVEPGGEAQAEPSSTRSRAKRFMSEARYVETLLVADTSMVHFYGDDLKVRCSFLAFVAGRDPQQVPIVTPRRRAGMGSVESGSHCFDLTRCV